MSISPTLVVGGELNQLKSGGESLTFWASFWGAEGLPPGCAPGWANSPGFGPTIGIRVGSAISCARAHLGGVGPKPSEPWV